ncbi:hypothetical protein CDO52_00265 [Nocardiopsis gilva YIM 90087]|uniref:Uncharacterized protein n=1 Tax=Nocardiopsis gilva YIM 90087 TaxID=1235441 RepID=A0A223RZX4_9ACTN|nr:hypothetical protein CDO52_00265 [Nocardiopsis gilva YIM 90087]
MRGEHVVVALAYSELVALGDLLVLSGGEQVVGQPACQASVELLGGVERDGVESDSQRGEGCVEGQDDHGTAAGADVELGTESSSGHQHPCDGSGDG